MKTFDQWQIDLWNKTEEGKIFLEYVKETGDTEPIGLQVPTGYPSGIKNSEDITKVYKECIKKEITWKELLGIEEPPEDADIQKKGLNQLRLNIEKPLFWDYAVFNDDAELVGIKKDAPQEAVESYEEYLKLKKKAEKEGFKI